MPNTQNIDHRLATLINNLATDFSLDKLSKSPARFDMQKLTWFNREYLKMLSLDEFCTRAAELKLDYRTTDSKLRVGDYVYLVDFKTQKTFTQIIGAYNQNVTNELWYHQLGGGRENGEDSMTCVARETLEETDGKLVLDKTKLIKIATFHSLHPEPKESENPDTKGREIYEGLEQNIYFYEFDQGEFGEYQNSENAKFEWVDLTMVLAKNDYLTYPIWKAFCIQNDLACVQPSQEILTQYLAWQLDKNRVSTLVEFGTESQTILNWQQPSVSEITWKKITETQSLENLHEIQKTIENLQNSFEFNIKQEQANLFEIVKKEIYFKSDKKTEAALSDLASKWETELKKWLAENGKDAGSYFWPLRVALSGKQKSPSPFEILAILSPNEVSRRLSSF